jgi:hypothetical protein
LRRPHVRIGAFIALSVVCASASTLYVVYSARRPTPASPRVPMAPPATSAPITPASASTEPERQRLPLADRTPPPAKDEVRAKVPSPSTEPPRLVFRSTALGPTYGALATLPVAALTGTPTITALSCDRVHVAAGTGVCLVANLGVFTTYRAIVFDAAFQPRHTLRLGGAPSRVRLSPDGRVAAITVFVSGHSYAAATFSTLTTMVDLKSGDLLTDDVEKFTILRDGTPFREVDFNIWGVTFARDSRRFYATLRTGGRTHLIEGDLTARTARIVRDEVECPSLSPDNTRLAFKKREGGGFGPVTWRLSVLDLKTLEEVPLSENRSVDDQVEWLDDGHVLYSLPREGTALTDTWVVPADGTAAPRLFLPKSYSTVILRQ